MVTGTLMWGACGGAKDSAPTASLPTTDTTTTAATDIPPETTRKAAPAGGQIAVFVRASPSKLGAPRTIGVDGAITVTLVGSGGTRRSMGAPATWCGAAPGEWTVTAESPGYLPTSTKVQVREGLPTLVDLELQAAGRLSLVLPDGVKGPVQARLKPPGKDAPEMITLPYEADEQPHGLYTLTLPREALGDGEKIRVKGDVTLTVAVPPTERVRVVASGEGLVVGGEHHALVTDGKRVPVSTFQTTAPSLYRVRRGRRTFRKRRYDLGPVKNLEELQWKVRSVIVHRHVGPLEGVIKEWVEAKEGRHLVVGPTGQVLQLLDLKEEAKAVGHLIDETTIHVSVAAGPECDKKAQERTLGALLGTLSRLLPRVQPRFPTTDDGRPVSGRLVDPRAHKGWMLAHHVIAPPKTAVPPKKTPTAETGALALNEAAIQSAAMALFDRGGEAQTAGRTDDGYQSLTVRASLTPAKSELGAASPPKTTSPKLELTAPSGARKSGRGIVVACQPEEGRWLVEANAPKHAMERRRPKLASSPPADRFEDIRLSRVGDVKIAGPAGLTASLSGPGGLVMDVKLPYEGRGLKAGTYRLGIDRKTAAMPPYRLGFRIDADRVSHLEVPAMDDPSLPHILIGGAPFPLPAGLKVIHYRDPGALSFYAAQVAIGDADRLYLQRVLPSGRPVKTSADIAQVARMIVLHADVIKDTPTTFEALASKGLSTHFGIEWDGTIYQMLDPQEGAFAAAEVNPYSVQIDLNNLLPNLVKTPRARPYPRPHRDAKRMNLPEYKRPKSRRVSINGRDVQSYGYTDAQYRSLIALLHVLTGSLTRVAPEVPLEPDGTVPLNFFDGAEHFDGIIAHWHLTPRRWDPGPGFDWKRLRRGLAGQQPSSTSPAKASP